MMLRKPQIAIDGTAASGKGTLARKLGEALNYVVLDTGKLYRFIGMSCHEHGIDPDNERSVVNHAKEILSVDYWMYDLHGKIESIEADIAGVMASKTSQYHGVRSLLLATQREFAKNPPNGKDGAILDGRDIGTVVLPQADLKLFVTADIEIRAKRRHKELHFMDNSVMYEAVLAEMQDRDARDANRSVAPMKPAEDAIILDTSNLSPDDALEKALDLVKQKISI